MPADARREPLPDAGYGPGRPPDGPPEEEPWGFARGFRSLFKWPQENAAPALPPLTASGLRARNEDGSPVGGVHRLAASSTRPTKANGLILVAKCSQLYAERLRRQTTDVDDED